MAKINKNKKLKQFKKAWVKFFKRPKVEQFNLKRFKKNKAVKKTLPYFLPLTLGGVILLLFLSLLLPKTRFQKAKERTAKNPADFEAHLILAEELLEENQLQQAENELLIVKGLYPDHYKLEELWQLKNNLNPKNIKRSIGQWERIIDQKPGFRDAYLHLSLLYFRLGENEKAQKYLEEALIIDPNFQPAKNLEEKIRP